MSSRRKQATHRAARLTIDHRGNVGVENPTDRDPSMRLRWYHVAALGTAAIGSLVLTRGVAAEAAAEKHMDEFLRRSPAAEMQSSKAGNNFDAKLAELFSDPKNMKDYKVSLGWRGYGDNIAKRVLMNSGVEAGDIQVLQAREELEKANPDEFDGILNDGETIRVPGSADLDPSTQRAELYPEETGNINQ